MSRNTTKYETLYFDWYDKPAIIVPVEHGDMSYFLNPKDSEWTLATPHQTADYFYRGIKLSKEEFEEKFGKFGKNLPEPKDI